MATIWDEHLESIQGLLKKVKDQHHPHLELASIWLLATNSNPIVDNKIVYTRVSRCTKTEKLKTNHDFKIIVSADVYLLLTDDQQEIVIDEALCRCGVKYMPQTIQTGNGKEEVVKDQLGRIIYTTEIALDSEGMPRWKLNKPDAETFFALLQRRGLYSQEIQNIDNALTGKPIVKPFVVDQAPIDSVMDDEAIKALATPPPEPPPAPVQPSMPIPEPIGVDKDRIVELEE